MDRRSYWTEMEYQAGEELRAFFWKQVERLYGEAVLEGSAAKMKEAFSIKLRDLVEKHERLQHLTLETLSGVANEADDDD